MSENLQPGLQRVPAKRKYLTKQGDVRIYNTSVVKKVTDRKRGAPQKPNRLELRVICTQLNEQQCLDVITYAKTLIQPLSQT